MKIEKNVNENAAAAQRHSDLRTIKKIFTHSAENWETSIITHTNDITLSHIKKSFQIGRPVLVLA